MLYSISKLLSLSFFSFDLTAESEKAVLAIWHPQQQLIQLQMKNRDGYGI